MKANIAHMLTSIKKVVHNHQHCLTIKGFAAPEFLQKLVNLGLIRSFQQSNNLIFLVLNNNRSVLSAQMVKGSFPAKSNFKKAIRVGGSIILANTDKGLLSSSELSKHGVGGKSLAQLV